MREGKVTGENASLLTLSPLINQAVPDVCAVTASESIVERGLN